MSAGVCSPAAYPLIFMDGEQTPAEAARRWWGEPDHYATLRAAWIDHGLQGWPVPDPAMVARARAELIARSEVAHSAHLLNCDKYHKTTGAA